MGVAPSTCNFPGGIKELSPATVDDKPLLKLPSLKLTASLLDGWNTIVSFWGNLGLSSGAFAVSFRKCNSLYIHKRTSRVRPSSICHHQIISFGQIYNFMAI